MFFDNDDKMPAIKSVWETKCYRDCVKEYLDDKMNTCYREHIGDEWNMCYRYLWERTYVIKGIPTYWRCVLWEDFVRWYEPTESVMWKRERERERERRRDLHPMLFFDQLIFVYAIFIWLITREATGPINFFRAREENILTLDSF